MDELKRIVSLYCDLINYQNLLEDVEEYLDETAEDNEDYAFEGLLDSVGDSCNKIEESLETVRDDLFEMLDDFPKEAVFGVDFTINENFKNGVENALMDMCWGYTVEGNFENFKTAVKDTVKIL